MNTRLLFLTTIVVSTLAHAGLYVYLNDKDVDSSSAAAEVAPYVTRVVFNSPITNLPNTPVVEKQPPKPKPVKKTEPKQLAKTPPKAIKPKPKPAPPIEPEPPEIQGPELAEAVTEPQPQTIPQQAAAVATAMKSTEAVSQDPSSSEFMAEDEQQQYKSRLLAYIESHKYYPHAARKRGIEGEIIVSFILSAEGEVRDMDVKGGPRMLRKAASKAVNASLPLPKPPKTLAEPMQIQYKMAFAIQ